MPSPRGRGAWPPCRQFAEREAAEFQLVGVVANRNQLWSRAVRPRNAARHRPAHDAADVMAGGERLRAEIARHAEQIGEFGSGCSARRARASRRRVAGGKIVDHRRPEPGSRRRSRNAGCRAAPPRRARRGCPGRRSRRPCARGRAMIIELQGDADHLMAGFVEEPGDDAAIHPAGHGDYDTQTALRSGGLRRCARHRPAAQPRSHSTWCSPAVRAR